MYNINKYGLVNSLYWYPKSPQKVLSIQTNEFYFFLEKSTCWTSGVHDSEFFYGQILLPKTVQW